MGMLQEAEAEAVNLLPLPRKCLLTSSGSRQNTNTPKVRLDVSALVHNTNTDLYQRHQALVQTETHLLVTISLGGRCHSWNAEQEFSEPEQVEWEKFISQGKSCAGCSSLTRLRV